ncbi:MAG: hypothetical protein M1816_000798 [Peltula sp. TS41687]|nr:MAG: hypothetical protein M1816_000798 [Peltula sp. TS41687]
MTAELRKMQRDADTIVAAPAEHRATLFALYKENLDDFEFALEQLLFCQGSAETWLRQQQVHAMRVLVDTISKAERLPPMAWMPIPGGFGD